MYAISRFQCGVTINPKEYVRDRNNEVMEFETKDKAIVFQHRTMIQTTLKIKAFISMNIKKQGEVMPRKRKYPEYIIELREQDMTGDMKFLVNLLVSEGRGWYMAVGKWNGKSKKEAIKQRKVRNKVKPIKMMN